MCVPITRVLCPKRDLSPAVRSLVRPGPLIGIVRAKRPPVPPPECGRRPAHTGSPRRSPVHCPRTVRKFPSTVSWDPERPSEPTTFVACDRVGGSFRLEGDTFQIERGIRTSVNLGESTD